MITTKEIQAFILKHWLDKFHCHYVCSNFNGAGYEEMDVIAITAAGIVNEFEVKISRSDFYADFKKELKHLTYSGKYSDGQMHVMATGRPNRFFYAVPENLVSADEVPEYAGLIYFKKFQLKNHPGKTFVEYNIVKKAPYLHREKAPQALINRLCRTLSCRLVFGCSIQSFNQKRNAEEFSL